MNAASSPLHVAHLLHHLGAGGLESVVCQLIHHLPAPEFHHTIICLTDWDARFARRLPAHTPLYALHKQAGQDWPVWGRLWRLLRQVRPQILHSCNLATLEGALPAWLAGVPVRIHAEHGRDIYDLDGSHRLYRGLRRLYAPLIQSFVPVSHELEGWLLEQVRLPRAKVRFIPNGVDVTRFQPGARPLPPGLPADFLVPGAFVFGSVGRLAAVKNHAALLRALHRLGPEGTRPLRLILVGDGPLRAELEGLTRSLGLVGRVHFAGEQEDIPAWLGVMQLFVLPSLAEGMPLTLLEAMASGLPVLTTRCGDCAHLVGEDGCGEVVPVGDEVALAQAMGRYAAADGVASQGVRARQRVVAHYDLAWSMAQYRTLFQEAVARCGR